MLYRGDFHTKKYMSQISREQGINLVNDIIAAL